ncbi:OLC1v1030089C1 [Oldenlandia corymbosa var. corymbosa]|uniref:OLC1v1030089C1 n=1 Tax=Oldenlandia corymbosa var. corymbosa TaxID=529605 RepID=A0AAV1CI92_OLDCO|nr:OLC1v1030089C1 [Oldenlandia corymbosa var. corymbosa]
MENPSQGPWFFDEDNLRRYRDECFVRRLHEYGLISHDDKFKEASPIGRVFKQGSPEYCPDIISYSIDEFPSKDLAFSYGICQYWALPICELDASGQPQLHCIGVLEFLLHRDIGHVAPAKATFNSIGHALKSLGLTCQGLHSADCYSSHAKLYASLPIAGVLNVVRKKLQLDAILRWVPCMCNGSAAFAKSNKNATKLILRSASVESNFEFVEDLKEMTSNAACVVKEGKGSVGKAFSLKKACFFNDTSKRRISDYPLAPFIAGFAASFAIPLQLVHPNLPPSILEVYAPLRQTGTMDMKEALLKSLLSTLAEKLSVYNADFGLGQNEGFQISHSCPSPTARLSRDVDNINCFDVHRIAGCLNPVRAVAPKREELFASLEPPKRRTTAGNRRPIMTNGEEHRLPSSDKLPRKSTHDVERENFSLINYPSTHDKAKNPEILFADENVGITLDDFIQQSGEKLNDIGEALGVKRPTLKRIREELGTYWRPLLKRYKVNGIQSNPNQPNTSVEPVGGETIRKSACRPGSDDDAGVNVISAAIHAGSEGKNKVRRSYEAGSSYTMAVKATYKGDIVKFPLGSNSGIEKLRTELDKRFELQVERFKIKYEEDGEWIMMCYDEDLHLHMDSLNASGVTMMKLSVSLPD